MSNIETSTLLPPLTTCTHISPIMTVNFFLKKNEQYIMQVQLAPPSVYFASPHSNFGTEVIADSH